MQTPLCIRISAPIAPTSCPSVDVPCAPWHPIPNWGQLCTLQHICPKAHYIMAPSLVPHSPRPVTGAPHIPGGHPPIAAPLCSILTRILPHCMQTSHPIAHVAHPKLHMHPFQAHPLCPTTWSPAPHTCSPSPHRISPTPCPTAGTPRIPLFVYFTPIPSSSRCPTAPHGAL